MGTTLRKIHLTLVGRHFLRSPHRIQSLLVRTYRTVGYIAVTTSRVSSHAIIFGRLSPPARWKNEMKMLTLTSFSSFRQNSNFKSSKANVITRWWTKSLGNSSNKMALFYRLQHKSSRSSLFSLVAEILSSIWVALSGICGKSAYEMTRTWPTVRSRPLDLSRMLTSDWNDRKKVAFGPERILIAWNRQSFLPSELLSSYSYFRGDDDAADDDGETLRKDMYRSETWDCNRLCGIAWEGGVHLTSLDSKPSSCIR